MAGTSNAAQLRGMYDAFERRDLEAFVSHCSPDIELDSDIGAYPAGHAGVRGWWRDMMEAFAVGAPRIDLVIEIDDATVALTGSQWRGHASGVEFEAKRMHVARWRDGLTVWWGFYLSLEDALASARLEPRHVTALETALRIHESFEAINRRDFDAAVRPAHPDVEIHARMAAVEGSTWRGRDGVREWIEETFEAFDTFHLDVREMRWLGDRCLTFAHLRARGRQSGIELDRPWIYLATMRDGLIIRLESFVDEKEALAAAQVSP